MRTMINTKKLRILFQSKVYIKLVQKMQANSQQTNLKQGMNTTFWQSCIFIFSVMLSDHIGGYKCFLSGNMCIPWS